MNKSLVSSRLAALAVLLGSIGWGLTWIPLKYITGHGLHSSYLILFAFGAGSVVLLPFLFLHYQHCRRHIQVLLLIALIGGLSNVTFQTAMANGDVVRVMILFYMLPIWSVIGGRLVLKEHIDRSRMLAVALCLGGGAMILDVFNVTWHQVHWIDVMALLSGLLLASTNIIYRFSYNVSIFAKTLFMFIGCFCMMGISLFLLPVTTPMPGMNIIWLAIAYGAIGITIITLSTQWGVTHTEAGRASVIIVSELFVAVLSSSIILATPLRTPEIIGGIMVVIAALIEGLRKPRKVE